MQTDANDATGVRRQPTSFDRATKDRALKLLLDYSRYTGKKWALILKEILALADANESERAPLLVRQDLEAWAIRKTEIGDQKFAIVYRFLTHPTTLERPEFANANSLFDATNEIREVGRALAKALDLKQLFATEPSINALYKDRLCGVYRARAKSITRTHLLYIFRLDREDFLCFHQFSFDSETVLSIDEQQIYTFTTKPNPDWNFVRTSGFVSFGTGFRLHGKDSLTRRPTTEILTVFSRNEAVTSISLVDSSFLENIDNFLRNGEGKLMKYSQPKLEHHESIYEPFHNMEILDIFVDRLKMDVLL